MLLRSKPNTVRFSISLHLHCLAKQSPCPISPWTMRNGCQLPRVCLPVPTHDVLYSCHVFYAPYVYQSKCITSFACALLWPHHRYMGLLRTWQAGLLPSVFVELLALFIKVLYESVWCCGRDRQRFRVKPWSSQMHISRHCRGVALYAGYTFTCNQDEQT